MAADPSLDSGNSRVVQTAEEMRLPVRSMRPRNDTPLPLPLRRADASTLPAVAAPLPPRRAYALP